MDGVVSSVTLSNALSLRRKRASTHAITWKYVFPAHTFNVPSVVLQKLLWSLWRWQVTKYGQYYTRKLSRTRNVEGTICHLDHFTESNHLYSLPCFSYSTICYSSLVFVMGEGHRNRVLSLCSMFMFVSHSSALSRLKVFHDEWNVMAFLYWKYSQSRIIQLLSCLVLFSRLESILTNE